MKGCTQKKTAIVQEVIRRLNVVVDYSTPDDTPSTVLRK